MLTLPYLSSLKFVGRLSTGILSQIELPAFLLFSAGSRLWKHCAPYNQKREESLFTTSY